MVPLPSDLHVIGPGGGEAERLIVGRPCADQKPAALLERKLGAQRLCHVGSAGDGLDDFTIANYFQLVYTIAACQLDVQFDRQRISVGRRKNVPRQFPAENLKDALERNARLREVGTKNLVDACAAAGVRHVIAQSIAFAYAPGPQPFTEDAPLNVNAADPVAARTARAAWSG